MDLALSLALVMAMVMVMALALALAMDLAMVMALVMALVMVMAMALVLAMAMVMALAMNNCKNCSFTWNKGKGSHDCQEVKDARLAELEAKNKELLDILHYFTGVFAPIGIAEPIEGFAKEPHWLKRAVRDLIKKLEKSDEHRQSSTSHP